METTAPPDEVVTPLLALAGDEAWPPAEWVPPPPLPPLEALAGRCGAEYNAACAKYRGPTARSNWILPHRLLCGGSPHDTLREVTSAGVTCMVSLQAKGEAKSYRDGVLKLSPASSFLEQPIADQEVTSDAQVAALTLRILARIHHGAVCYVHCRGGHGRTGTVCALVLGLAYGLDGPTALATYQALHDLRAQPCFASTGYEATEDGRSCVALFPVQRAQVMRLLRPVHVPAALPTAVPAAAAAAAAPTAEAAAAGVPILQRSLSDVYGRGASRYPESTLREWLAAGEAAGEAARQKDWSAACERYERCVELRPDWERAQRYLLLTRAKQQQQHQHQQHQHQHRHEHQDQQPPPPPPPTPPPTPPTPPTPPKTTTSSSSTTTTTMTMTTTAAAEMAATHAATATVPSRAPFAAHDTTAATAAAAAAAAAASNGVKRGGGGARRPSFVVLVGLPGAGKSTFARALSQGGEWEVISRDALGSTDAVESAVVNAIKAGKRVLVDRCNVRVADRKRILDIGMIEPSDAVAVHLTMAPEVCVQRVAARTDHPTIPYGHGRSAVASMAKALERPTLAEGFAAVHTLDNDVQVRALLRSWGGGEPEPVVPELAKFPRTHHVLNTGGSAVTRDDLVMSDTDARRFHDGSVTVVAEEKVDGANLGFSLTKDYEVRCQNRAHFVTSESQAQWRSLDAWLEEHSWALCQLLEPEIEVLFGEWCALRHSVPYSRLPGPFIAFDIYNKRTRTFASVAERNRRLRGLGIPIVRQIARRRFHSAKELLALLDEHSAYGEGLVEGAYLRIDALTDEGGTTNCVRGKIVRPDFIQGCGDGHWLSKEPIKNGIRPELWDEPAEEEDAVEDEAGTVIS